MPRRAMLRCGRIDADRFFTIEAGLLSQTQWEAWLACVRVRDVVGAGVLSDTLRVADDIADLQRWAADLDEAEIHSLVEELCP